MVSSYTTIRVHLDRLHDFQGPYYGATDTDLGRKLRLFIFVSNRNNSVQTLLNQYITGESQRQQDPNLKAAGSRAGTEVEPAGTEGLWAA
jgi:hypothetical protein